jgi:hypothetical protein
MGDKKSKRSQIDWLAIVAIVLSLVGFSVYIQPQPTGFVYPVERTYQLEDLTVEEVRAPKIPVDLCRDDNDTPLFIETDFSLIEIELVTHEFLCREVSPFWSGSLPLAGVFWLGAVLILLLRLKPVRAR